jgi:hypothetical protein
MLPPTEAFHVRMGCAGQHVPEKVYVTGYSCDYAKDKPTVEADICNACAVTFCQRVGKALPVQELINQPQKKRGWGRKS